MIRIAAVCVVLGLVVGSLAAVGIAAALLKVLCGLFLAVALGAFMAGLLLGRRSSAGRSTDEVR